MKDKERDRGRKRKGDSEPGRERVGKAGRRDENQSVRITGSTARINVLIRDTYRAVQRQSIGRDQRYSRSSQDLIARKLACADDSRARNDYSRLLIVRFSAERHSVFLEHFSECGRPASVFSIATLARKLRDDQSRHDHGKRKGMRLTRDATRRALKPSRGGVLVLRSTGTGRAEAERTLSILWDSAGPRVCGTRGERGGAGRGPQASAGPARGRRNERASVRVGACNSPTLPIRARTPLFAERVSFSFCLSLLSIYLYSFLIRAACRGPTPLAVGLTVGIRGARFRVCVLRDGPRAPERAHRGRSASLCSALLRSVLLRSVFCEGQLLLLLRRCRLKRYTAFLYIVCDISFVSLPSRLSAG